MALISNMLHLHQKQYLLRRHCVTAMPCQCGMAVTEWLPLVLFQFVLLPHIPLSASTTWQLSSDFRTLAYSLSISSRTAHSRTHFDTQNAYAIGALYRPSPGVGQGKCRPQKNSRTVPKPNLIIFSFSLPPLSCFL